MANLREKNRCPGCRDLDNRDPSKYRRKCIIKNCDIIMDRNWRYCSPKCEKYPCQRLKSLDKRYRTKYGMSMIENLENISQNGIRKFLASEKKRWVKGNRIFCVHHKKYYDMKK